MRFRIMSAWKNHRMMIPNQEKKAVSMAKLYWLWGYEYHTRKQADIPGKQEANKSQRITWQEIVDRFSIHTV